MQKRGEEYSRISSVELFVKYAKTVAYQQYRRSVLSLYNAKIANFWLTQCGHWLCSIKRTVLYVLHTSVIMTFLQGPFAIVFPPLCACASWKLKRVAGRTTPMTSTIFFMQFLYQSTIIKLLQDVMITAVKSCMLNHWSFIKIKFYQNFKFCNNTFCSL